MEAMATSSVMYPEVFNANKVAAISSGRWLTVRKAFLDGIIYSLSHWKMRLMKKTSLVFFYFIYKYFQISGYMFDDQINLEMRPYCPSLLCSPWLQQTEGAEREKLFKNANIDVGHKFPNNYSSLLFFLVAVLHKI